MSAVTAVPLRPLAPRSVLKLWLGLALLVLAGAGLAWWGTGWMQIVTLESGVRVQAVSEGSGPAVTAQDAFALRFRVHKNSLDAPVERETQEPFVGTLQDLPPGFGDGLQRMRAGGRYVLWLPARTVIPGEIPPGAGITAGDTLVIEVQVLQIDAGQASAYQMRAMQQMMQQQQMMRQMQQQGGVAGTGNSAVPAPAAPAGNSAAPTGR